MGMFDEVTCEYPLPDGEDGTQLPFQTKSLACTLTPYIIKRDGTLWVLGRTGHHSEPSYLTGVIDFYRYKPCNPLDQTRWINWQYQATFVQGVLQKITGQKTVDRSELEQAVWEVRHGGHREE